MLYTELKKVTNKSTRFDLNLKAPNATIILRYYMHRLGNIFEGL